jgi:hypothetical protein
MSEAIQRQSAKIYQFPAGGRAASSIKREPASAATSAKVATGSRIVFGSGWYHDDAIQEAAEISRKR